jgi:hypothetical protein
VPAGIDASGNRDVTGELNAFFAGLGPGVTVTFRADARYRVEGVVLLVNARDLTIEGNGATLFARTDGAGAPPPRRGFRRAWPRRREHVHIRGGRGVRLRDLTIEGANPEAGARRAAYVPSLEGQAGIAIARSDGVLLDGVRVSDTYGDFVWVTGGATGVTIRNSVLARSGRQGIAVVNGSHVLVEGNEIRDVARSVVDLEPLGRARVDDVRVIDNAIGDYVNFLLAAGGAGPGVTDVLLEGNRVAGGNGLAIAAGHPIQARRGLRIVGNTGSGRVRPPVGAARAGLIQLTNLDGVEVRDNEQPVAGGPALSLDRVCNLTEAGNRFPGASPVTEVVAPCGAAAPSPAAPSAPTAAPSSAPATGAAARVDADGEGGGDWLVAGLVGFVAGLGVAAAVIAVRRRRARRSPPSPPVAGPPAMNEESRARFPSGPARR